MFKRSVGALAEHPVPLETLLKRNTPNIYRRLDLVTAHVLRRSADDWMLRMAYVSSDAVDRCSAYILIVRFTGTRRIGGM